MYVYTEIILQTLFMMTKGSYLNLKSGKVWEISQRGDGGQRFRVKIPNAVYYNNVAGLENSQPDPRRKI